MSSAPIDRPPPAAGARISPQGLSTASCLTPDKLPPERCHGAPGGSSVIGCRCKSQVRPERIPVSLTDAHERHADIQHHYHEIGHGYARLYDDTA